MTIFSAVTAIGKRFVSSEEDGAVRREKILDQNKQKISKEIDLDSATDFIKDHLNEVISDVLFNELNEELLVANVIAFKKVA